MQAVERVTAVLLSFTSRHAERGVTDISKQLNLPKSAVHRILESLVDSGLIRKDRDRGKYRLGTRAIELSLAALGTVDIRSLALPLMEHVRGATGETVTLTFAINHERIYVAQVESPQNVRMTVEIGGRAPLYAGASGRAILMTYDKEDLDAFLDEVELTPLTDRTPHDRAELLATLLEDGARGYSVSTGERDVHAAAVAAPVRARGGQAFAAMSVCGPRGRLDVDRLHECSAAVLAATQRLSQMVSGS